MKSIQQMVVQISGLLGTKDLSDWEQSFVESVASREAPLTDKQAEIVERIYRKHFA